MPDDLFKEFVPDQLGALLELRGAETERGWFAWPNFRFLFVTWI